MTLPYEKYGFSALLYGGGSLARLSHLRTGRFVDLIELIQQYSRGVEQEVVDVLD